MLSQFVAVLPGCYLRLRNHWSRKQASINNALTGAPLGPYNASWPPLSRATKTGYIEFELRIDKLGIFSEMPHNKAYL